MTLLEAISARHSVRKYLEREIPADIIAALQDKIMECNKIESHLNIQLVQNETKCIHGNAVVWFVHGVKNYLVMVGKKAKDLNERGLLWRATRPLCPQTLGLNTCWGDSRTRKVPEVGLQCR